MFHRICLEQKQKMEEDLDLFFNNNSSQQKKESTRRKSNRTKRQGSNHEIL